MGDIKLEVPPIGVKVLKSLDGFEDIVIVRGRPEQLNAVTDMFVFCTGAVAWGANRPSHLTSGLPGEMFDRVCGRLELPGKI